MRHVEGMGWPRDGQGESYLRDGVFGNMKLHGASS